MNTVTNIAVANEVKELKVFDPNLGSYGFENLGEVVQFADLMSKAGPMLPAHCQNNPAICLAVTMRATHWGFDPFALAQETFQTSSNSPVAYSAKVFVAALKNCAKIELQYRYEGEVQVLNEPAKSARGNVVAQRKAVGNRRCIAFAEVNGKLLEYATPELDNVTVKNSALWHNDPDQQLAYYAGRGWARRHQPGVIMGAYSTDEVEEIQSPMRDVTPAPAKGGFAERANAAAQITQQDPAPEATEEREAAPVEAEALESPQNEVAEPENDGFDLPQGFEPDPFHESYDAGRQAFGADYPVESAEGLSGEARFNYIAGWHFAANEAAKAEV